MNKIQEISLFVSYQSEIIRAISIEYPPREKLISFAPQPSHLWRWPFHHSVSQEELFYTAFALLITEPLWGSIFLQSEKTRTHFLRHLAPLASLYGAMIGPCEIDHILKKSEDPAYRKKLLANKQRIGEEVIHDMQALLLDELDKQPIISNLIAPPYPAWELTTRYVKYQLHGIEPSGRLVYQCRLNKSTASLCTQHNILPGARGALGQRIVESPSGRRYTASGELSTKNHVIEQLLALLHCTHEEVFLHSSLPEAQERTFLFTSLYSWNELDLLTQQQEAIESLNGKCLQTPQGTYRLRLLYMNVPLHSWTLLSETTARLKDLNTLALIHLTFATAQQISLPLFPLDSWVETLNQLDKDFFRAAHTRLTLIDSFSLYKQELIPYLRHSSAPLASLLCTLLTEKKENGTPLRGIDFLLTLEQLTQKLHITHHKNCKRGMHRASAALAADKAQEAFLHLCHSPFLGASEGAQLFETLYTLYLFWEEPTLHHLFNSNHSEAFETPLLKNREILRYLKI